MARTTPSAQPKHDQVRGGDGSATYKETSRLTPEAVPCSRIPLSPSTQGCKLLPSETRHLHVKVTFSTAACNTIPRILHLHLRCSFESASVLRSESLCNAFYQCQCQCQCPNRSPRPCHMCAWAGPLRCSPTVGSENTVRTSESLQFAVYITLLPETRTIQLTQV